MWSYRRSNWEGAHHLLPSSSSTSPPIPDRNLTIIATCPPIPGRHLTIIATDKLHIHLRVINLVFPSRGPWQHLFEPWLPGCQISCSVGAPPSLDCFDWTSIGDRYKYFSSLDLWHINVQMCDTWLTHDWTQVRKSDMLQPNPAKCRHMIADVGSHLFSDLSHFISWFFVCLASCVCWDNTMPFRGVKN